MHRYVTALARRAYTRRVENMVLLESTVINEGSILSHRMMLPAFGLVALAP